MDENTNTHALALFSNQLADLAASAAESIVGVGGASGVIVDAELVITPAHRLRRHRGLLSVRLPDGSTRAAERVGTDRGLDLALLRVADLPDAAPAWVDAPPRAGQLVLTVGRDSGQVRTSLGMIGAVLGPWRTRGGARVPRWIEADATLPAASAGGLLVGADGAVLGWNTPGLTRQGAVLPPETIKDAVARLRGGGGKPGYLGVSVQLVRLDEQTAGLLVSAVEDGSPAATAGLAVGDILLAADGVPLDDAGSLLGALRDRAGEDVSVTYSRGGEAAEVVVQPAERAARRRCG